MIPANVLLVLNATLSIVVGQSSAIPLNCTVTLNQTTGIKVKVGTNSTFTCEFYRRSSNTTIEVIQCINNYTDCIRNPGNFTEKDDINRSSTDTILSIRNHSEEVRLSCFNPYVKAPSTHLELPNDCLTLNHTYSDNPVKKIGIDVGMVVGIVVGIVGLLAGAGGFWMIRKRRCKCPAITKRFGNNQTRNDMETSPEMSGTNFPPEESALLVQPDDQGHGNVNARQEEENNDKKANESVPLVQPADQGQSNSNARQEEENNDNRANECDAHPSLVQPANSDTTTEEMDNAKGTTGMKDGYILHAKIDDDVARSIKIEIDEYCVKNVKNIKPLVDVSADVGAGQFEFSCLDTILMEYKWILLLATPQSHEDGVYLVKGQAILLDNLEQHANDPQHRLIPMLYKIKRGELKQSWLRVIQPVCHKDGIQKVVDLILRPIPNKICDAK